MMCYRDRSWCAQSAPGVEARCVNAECSRNLSDDEMRSAINWWRGDDVPIAFVTMRIDGCGYAATPSQGDRDEG